MRALTNPAEGGMFSACVKLNSRVKFQDWSTLAMAIARASATNSLTICYHNVFLLLFCGFMKSRPRCCR